MRYDMLEDVCAALRKQGMDVNECLSRAVEVTNDWRFASSGAAAIYDRLSQRREFAKLRDLCGVLNPQPAAQSVTGVGMMFPSMSCSKSQPARHI